MNTSCDSKWAPASDTAVRKFQYPMIAGKKPVASESGLASDASAWMARERAILEGQSAAVEAARQEAVRENEAKSQKLLAEASEVFKSELLQTVEGFRQERCEYFRRVEAEIVKLVMTITRKVLHRESQVDPLLLQGAVHVAMERMSSGSQVVLRVSGASLNHWQKYLSDHALTGSTVELVADAELTGEHCVLTSELGSTEINLEQQLQEIETGFLDLLASRERSPR